MKTIILATRNPGKVREFSQLLAPLGYEVLTAAQAGYHEEPEETGTTFRENALIKARAVYEGTGGRYAVLSDDSGLAVDALGGAPGVYSARYAGPGCTDDDNNKKLLKELNAATSTDTGRSLSGKPTSVGPSSKGRTARYQIALCLLEPGTSTMVGNSGSTCSVTGEEKARSLSGKSSSVGPSSKGGPVFFEGACEGVIGFEEKGTGGFGYDVLFIPTGEDGAPLDGRTFAGMTAAEKHPLSHRGKAVAKLMEFLKSR